ncbi:helix-turn-helix transcriptional regulator [Undibacterium sp.]|uniref:helix-turn-helix transcriptional regulator n=1 Tax=Undibacterium sp. TaxID=1914977 RepID=UPI0037527D94
MEMKAKSSLIRKYRSDKLWSQEQLAQACGLGLRTIQRIEAGGSASQETIKALAAVFEVESESLVWRDGCYQIYSHKQWGIFTFAAIPLLSVCILAFNDKVYALPTLGLGVLFGLLTVILILFSSMTIEVNESELTWFFGLGALKKSIPLEEIGSCSKVRNPLWMGFGIHTFGTGYIYNVSGLLGVQIELKSGAFLRLGTGQPNYLLQAISDAKDNLNE